MGEAGAAAWAAWAARHAARDFGGCGVREATLEVFDGDIVATTYRLVHLWRRDGQACRSRMELTAPKVMAGTSIILVERAGSWRTEIWLKLRTASRVLRIAPERCLEPVLGSDFSYEDLRFWLATAEVTGVESLDPGPGGAARFAGLRTLPDGSRAAVELQVGPDGELASLVQRAGARAGAGAGSTGEGAGAGTAERPWTRRVLTTAWSRLGGMIWPAERIVERDGGAYRSRMRLVGADLDFTPAWDAFDPGRLGDASPGPADTARLRPTGQAGPA